MYINKVEICGVNTAKLKTLTEEEKRALLVRTKSGDREARSELICGNLRLVLSIIQRFTNRHENLDDLFQVGCIGLIKAIDNFNIALDVRFSTYAVPMIIGELRRYLRDNNSIRVSRSIRDLAYRALQAREEIQKGMQRDATLDEIAEKIGEKKSAVAAAMEAITPPVSLYESVYNDGDESVYVIDQIKNSEDCDDVWIEDIALKEALKKLGERERSIITKRFYNGKTQMEIAAEIGISQAQVSRLEKSAIDKIRKEM